MMKGIWHDVRHGLHILQRHRGHTALAVAMLGTAIGLNTSLFTAFNAVALQPWPVPDPERVVRVYAAHKGPQGPVYQGLSVTQQRHLNARARTMAGLVGMREAGSHDGLRGTYVTASFFEVLQIPIQMGRGFHANEDQPTAPAALAVVSHRTWQGRLAGARDVVGRTIVFKEVPFTIIGVTAPTFTGTSGKHEDLWIPLSASLLLHPKERWPRDFLTEPGWSGLEVAGRLAPGVSPEQARLELEHLSRAYQASMGRDGHGVAVSTTSLAAHLRERRKILPVSGLLFLALTLVLLLACANVGNVVLARGLARRHEIAVRISLGARRARLVRQMLTEGLVLAAAAGAVGLAMACVLPRILPSVMKTNLSADLQPDLAVLAYTLGLVVLSCVVFALPPALHCTRGDVASALQERAASSGTRLALRSGLLALQVSLCVVLLASAGLLVRSVQQASRFNPKFALHELVLVSFHVDDREYDDARRLAFGNGLERALGNLPGGPSFALTDQVPLGNSRSLTSARLPGQNDRQAMPVFVKEISGRYFETLEIPVVAGRALDSADAGRPVVVVSQTLARRYWSDNNPLGQTIVINTAAREIVGVARDAHLDDLDRIEATAFVPLTRPVVPYLLIRDDGHATLPALTAVAARVDPQARVSVRPLGGNIASRLQPAKTGALTAAILGVLALVLATIGLSGVFTYSVQQRTREIGIRMALGAGAADVVRLVLASSSRAVTIGLVLGLGGALGASRLLRSHLYGISPLDPLVYAGVLAVLFLAAVVASYVPARRAIGVEPTVALRYE